MQPPEPSLANPGQSPSLRPVCEEPTGPAGPGVARRAPEGAVCLLPPSEWISDYTDSVLDPEALRVDVDTFMEAYDRKMAEVGFKGPHLTVAWGRRCRGCGVAPGGGGAADPVTMWSLDAPFPAESQSPELLASSR